MAVQQIPLTAEREANLVRWIDENLQLVIDRVESRSARWRRWREQYEGKASSKNFPWPKASNVWVPVTAIATDAIHANLMNRLFGGGRMLDVTPRHPAVEVGLDASTGQPLTWTDMSLAAQDYLAAVTSDTSPSSIYDPIEDGLLQSVKLGTTIWYTPWVTLTKPDFELDSESGALMRKAEKTTFDGILPTVIELEDFVVLPHYSEIHGPHSSPMVGHRYWLRSGQLRQAERDGWYRRGRVNQVLGFSGAGEEEIVKDAQARLEGDVDTITNLRRSDYQVYDLWITVDFDDDGLEENLFVSYHKPTSTILRIQPWLYKTRPYIVARYLRREKRFYGIGIPEMLESLQTGVNTNVNQAIDNATIANVRAFATRRNSVAARSLDNYYPGKRIYFDQPDEIKDFQLGEVYPSIFEIGRILQQYGERRTGVSDYNLGRESASLGRQGTATTTLALLQESSRRFDLYARDIRRALSELGTQMLERIQQFRPSGHIYAVLGPDKAQLAERVLLLPTSIELRDHLTVSTTSSSASGNREIVRQNALTGFGLLSQYLDRMANIALSIASPQIDPSVKEFFYKAAQVGEKLMIRILENFDLNDIAAFLPQLEALYARSQSAVAPPLGPGQPGAMEAPGALPPGIAPAGAPALGGIGGLPGGPGMAGP